MKKFALWLLANLLLWPGYVWATTTVTGKMQTLGTGNITSGAFMRFYLRGCGGNQPRVAGSGLIGPTQGGVFYFDIPADSGGNVSGTLYSTRDGAGTGNGDIECGGSRTAVWYGMTAFVAGKAGPEVPVHAKSGGTLDISAVTPITTNPVTTAPTGDGTYLRLDAGNSPVTGSVTLSAGGTLLGSYAGTPTFSGLVSLNGGGNLSGTFTGSNASGTFSNAGIFSSSQMNVYIQSLLNSCNVSTEFHALFSTSFATEAGSFCALVPNTASATGLQVNGVSGYINNSVGSHGTPSVGVFGAGRIAATNARVWGGNFIGSDVPGTFASDSVYGTESDCFVQNVGTLCHGMLVTGFNAGGIQPTTQYGIEIAPLGGSPPAPWSFGLRFDLGATAALDGTHAAILLDRMASGNSQPSQGINFTSTNSGGTNPTGLLNQSAAGDLTFTQTAGGHGFTLGTAAMPMTWTEGPATAAATAGFEVCYGDSTAHALKCSYNSGSFLNVTQTIASGTATMTTAAIASGACGTTVTVSATGVATTDAIASSFNAAPAANPAELVVSSWPTANNVNFQYCNPSAGSITPNAATLNWRVTR